MSIDSLNHSDVFILDNNGIIYQWNPAGASKMEQLKGSVFANQIKNDDRCGKGQLIVLGNTFYFIPLKNESLLQTRLIPTLI